MWTRARKPRTRADARPNKSHPPHATNALPAPPHTTLYVHAFRANFSGLLDQQCSPYVYICTLHYHAMLEGPENALTLKTL
jgi:hypothetical protein